MSHPWHLHGQDFYIVAMERHGTNNSHVGPLPFKGMSSLNASFNHINMAHPVW